MDVRFTLNKEDLWHYTLYSLFRKRWRLIVFLIMVIALSLSLGILLNLLSAAVFVLLFLALYVFRLRRSVSKIAKGAGKRGSQIITISSHGVQQQNEMSDSTSSWRAFKAINQDKYNLYFIIDNPGSIMMAYVIPRRVFATPQEAESFLQLARGYWNEQAGQAIMVQ